MKILRIPSTILEPRLVFGDNTPNIERKYGFQKKEENSKE